MRNIVRLLVLMLLLGFSGQIPGQAHAAAGECYVKKVDNFIFVLDRSGSMGFTYPDTGLSKVASAKDLLGHLNTLIPELEYTGNLAAFAPYEVFTKPAKYETMSYAKAIDSVPTDVLVAGFIGNPTPLGEGFESLEDLLKVLKGKTAIILMSDGEQNKGVGPVPVVKRLVRDYSVCVHAISYATTDSGQATLDDLTSFMNCSVAAKASDLKTKEARFDFLRKVLFGVEMAKAAPACIGDEDGDGVLDDKDKCPKTPKDLKVDKDGCPIPVAMKIKVLFDVDKWDIKPQYMAEVEKFAKFIAQYPGTTITVEGHTDSTASDEHNLKLSQNRAQAVVDALASKFGVDTARLKAKGFGETTPVASNKTAAGRAENRRTVGVLDGVFVKK